MQCSFVLKWSLTEQNSSLYSHFCLKLYCFSSCLLFPPNVLKEPTLSTFIPPAPSPKKSLSWRSVPYQSPNSRILLQHLIVKQPPPDSKTPGILDSPLPFLATPCLSLLNSDSPLLHIYRLHAPTSFHLGAHTLKLHRNAVEGCEDRITGCTELEKRHYKIIMGTIDGECKTGSDA